ncbi:MAG TPA: hypothetical protein PK264_16210 [Hyphomicrobiaceae bacterium]|nr:hypothetical protein [Hyphomicrobiaceae bacterium]
MRLRPLFLAATVTALSGCAIHPIPDDVSQYTTEDIVRNVRCEARDSVRTRIKMALDRNPAFAGIEPELILERSDYFARIKKADPLLAEKFLNYADSSIAYDFSFKITEKSDQSGSLSFQLPYPKRTFTLGADGGLGRERSGHRKFKTVETFRELVRLDCRSYVQPDANGLYPLTGSIGMTRVMNTFIELSELGGGKGDFSDVINFTTRIHAKADGKWVLSPLPKTFKLINATALISGERQDIHSLTIGIAFPLKDLRVAAVGPRPVSAFSARASPRIIDTTTRALEQLCIARAEEREDRLGKLRNIPPEIFCRREALAIVGSPM